MIRKGLGFTKCYQCGGETLVPVVKHWVCDSTIQSYLLGIIVWQAKSSSIESYTYYGIWKQCWHHLATLTGGFDRNFVVLRDHHSKETLFAIRIASDFNSNEMAFNMTSKILKPRSLDGILLQPKETSSHRSLRKNCPLHDWRSISHGEKRMVFPSFHWVF